MESSSVSANKSAGELRVRFLGTGTSTGIPQIGCHCKACTSSDPHDQRLRCSALIGLPSGKNLLIDCGPDFRRQIIDAGAPELEALLVSHSHYDHVGGIDDLRPYCKDGRHFPTYCQDDVARDLHKRNPWSFAKVLYPGVPTFAIHEIKAGESFELGGMDILPLRVMHGKLPILGYRIGPLGYITDCSTLPAESEKALRGVDTLIINALRHAPHPSHQNLSEALALIERIRPRRAYLIHLSHDMGPEAEVKLPEGVEIAHDNQEIFVPC